MRFVTARLAARDFDRLLRFSRKRWGVAVARSYADDIRSAVSLLLEHPAIGPIAVGLPDGLRHWSIRSHVIYYCVIADELTVVRILHASQDAAQHLS